jgi:hypothetical protein
MSKFKLLLLAISVTLLSACGGGGGGCSAGFGGIVGGAGACDKTPTDSPPLAVAGFDQSVLAGATVTLDGSFSRDPDGKPLTYLWTLRNKPAGSAATLSSSTVVLPTFVADKAGVYVASLKVNDGDKDSTLAFVTISTAEVNAAPVANAGTTQNVGLGSTVTLDGSFSSDANRDPLVFTWKFESIPTGSSAVLSSTAAVRPTFTADKAGSYVASLSVFDGRLISNFSTVTAIVSAVNSAPTARISTLATLAVGQNVTLDGSSSFDPDRDPLTYKWVLISQPPGSNETLSSTTISKPTLTASKAGNYVASLVVNDGTVNSDYAFITLTVITPPETPLAMAGSDQSVLTGTTVKLDGSLSRDPDGRPLTYFWTLRNKPTGSAATLSSSTAALPTFVADKAGVYVASLRVNNSSKDSTLALVTILAAEVNAAPVANAGTTQNVKLSSTVTLDGSFSSDANRDPLVYSWKIESAPAGSSTALSSASAVRPSFTPDKAGIYVVSLTVSDGSLSSNLATVTVIASATNSAPTALISAMAPVAMGKTVTLDGSTSADPDRDLLSYKWVLISQPPGSSEALSSTTTAKPTLTASTTGNYVASLVVNDGTVSSDYAFITLTVMAPPVAQAVITDGTAPLTGNITSGTALTLDATESTDPIKAALTYRWAVTAAPPASLAKLENPTAAKATFAPVIAGDYVITLVVNNGVADSKTVTLLLKVVAAAP